MSLKDKSSGQNTVQGAETSIVEQFVKGVSDEKDQASPVSSPIGQPLTSSSPIIKPSGQQSQNAQNEPQNPTSEYLTAKMMGDVGFMGVFVPGTGNGWEFKVLLVKEISDRRIQTLEIQVPRGWVFKPGGEIKQKEVVGSGKANIFVGDNLREVPVRIVNDQEIGNYVAHWKLYFGSLESPSRVLDAYVDGDEKSGFRVILSRSLVPTGKPQIRLAFSIFSLGSEESTVFSGSGDIVGKVKATIKFFDGTSVEIEN